MKTHGRVGGCQSPLPSQMKSSWSSMLRLVKKRPMWRVSLTNNLEVNRGDLDQDRWGYPWWCGSFVRQITGKPIKFTGTAEKSLISKPFHPDRMSGRILGMGISADAAASRTR